MALTSFDGGFSSKQQRLEKFGAAANETIKVSKEQWARLQDTPSAQRQRQSQATAEERTRLRDIIRAQRDADFQPEEEDWAAPKAFEYDRCVDYYMVLGVDEHASLQEIKTAYRKLSLAYHPDKTGSLDQEQRLERQLIFIEIKNAYKTLSDQATRRQYDRDRDHDWATAEVSGKQIKVKSSFDARDILRRLSRGGSLDTDAVLDIPVRCRLEKFFWGGCKIAKRFHTRTGNAYEVPYILNLPPGAPEGRTISFKSTGESQDDAAMDRLDFKLTSKPHKDVERVDADLVVKQVLRLEQDLFVQPLLSLDVAGVRGQHLLVWGRNPFFLHEDGAAAELEVSISGEGLPPQGSFRFSAKLGASGSAAGPSGPGEDQAIEACEGVTVRLSHLLTKAKMAVRVNADATVADVKAKARQFLEFSLSDKILVLAQTATGFTPYADDTAVGDLRSLGLGGKQWREVPLGRDRATRILQSVVGLCGSESFKAKLAAAYALGEAAEQQVGSLWEGACGFLPDWGFEDSIESLKDIVARGLAELEGESSSELLRSRCRQLVIGYAPEEFQAEETGGAAGSADQQGKPRSSKMLRCSVELQRLPGELCLRTRPECSLRIYSNWQQRASPSPGQLRPQLVFAVSLRCPRAASGRHAEAFSQLRSALLPLLRDTLHLLAAPVRRLLPRPLANEACAGAPRIRAEEANPAAVCLCQAMRAAREGFHFLAASQLAATLELESLTPEERCELLAARGENLLALGECEAAAGTLEAALAFRPDSVRLWRLLGEARERLPDQDSAEAYRRALLLDPCLELADSLQRVLCAQQAPDSLAAGQEKRRGDVALEATDFPAAVHAYTAALARLPQEEQMTKAVLLANRSGAFAQLGRWESAAADARTAVAAAPDLAAAHGRLGVALLGCRRYEEAYPSLARAVALAPERRRLVRAWQTCSSLLPLWHSLVAQVRASRWGLDLCRGGTRVFALSDIAFHTKAGEDWMSRIDKSKFQDHILLIAGNLGASLASIARALSFLKTRFRRVFFLPGNSDLAIHPGEASMFPDSVAKMLAVLAVCDELGVDVAPAAVGGGVLVLPLYSWYNAWFDKEDPFPDPAAKPDKRCSWGRLDRDMQVWKFFLSLNKAHLRPQHHEKVITFSHFMPRQDLPYNPHLSAKTLGCAELDEQVRAARSNMHFYGHAGRSHTKQLGGVLYVQHELRHEAKSQFSHAPVMCLYDGEKLCSEPCSITSP